MKKLVLILSKHLIINVPEGLWIILLKIFEYKFDLTENTFSSSILIIVIIFVTANLENKTIN